MLKRAPTRIELKPDDRQEYLAHVQQQSHNQHDAQTTPTDTNARSPAAAAAASQQQSTHARIGLPQAVAYQR